MRTLPLFVVCVAAIAITACGPSASGSTGGTTPAVGGTSRPGGPPNLIGMVPGQAVVALHTDLNVARQDPARYERIASGLVSELGLHNEAATLRQLLDLTDSAVGVFVPGSPTQEGMLVFTGRFTDAHFESLLALAAARHGSTPTPNQGGSGRYYTMGTATLAQLDTWTWAIGHGPTVQQYIAQLSLNGGGGFSQSLLEFGPRIGLPSGSAQAWASQETQVGADMVGLVFAGENPQMVHNFVVTVKRHLGL